MITNHRRTAFLDVDRRPCNRRNPHE